MSPDEIKRLRLAYPLTTTELGDLIGVDAQSIRCYERGERRPGATAVRLLEIVFGLRGCPCPQRRHATARTGVPHWTGEETAHLRRLVISGASPDETVEALAATHGYRRTRRAVVHRAGLIGCSFYRDQYSGGDVARMLGVTHWRVGHWIERGLLRAERHVSLRGGATSRWWRIERPDIEAFIERHAGAEFDPSRVRDRGLKARAEIAGARNRRTA